VVEELDRNTPPTPGAAGPHPGRARPAGSPGADLSGDIALKPGELRIDFSGAEDLAAKLFELSQVMANDWQASARAAEEETNGRARIGWSVVRTLSHSVSTRS
jgi:hypothetical protein